MPSNLSEPQISDMCRNCTVLLAGPRRVSGVTAGTVRVASGHRPASGHAPVAPEQARSQLGFKWATGRALLGLAGTSCMPGHRG